MALLYFQPKTCRGGAASFMPELEWAVETMHWSIGCSYKKIIAALEQNNPAKLNLLRILHQPAEAV